jgi:hypothetical protein
VIPSQEQVSPRNGPGIFFKVIYLAIYRGSLPLLFAHLAPLVFGFLPIFHIQNFCELS